MSAETGLLGGDLIGDHTITVLDPRRIVAEWKRQATFYGWRTFDVNIPDTNHKVFYLANDRGAVFLWMWMES